VLGVRPAAGTVLELPATVELVVSAGPPEAPQVTVPSLTDLSEPAARAALQAAGLRLGAVLYDPDTGRPLGGVVSQQPAAGASVPAGSAVRITVAGSAPAAQAAPDTTEAGEPGTEGND
jgi:serine/threonine-protein kinase